MPNIDRFYITGGTLPQEAVSYVARAADRELLEGLRAGEYCSVLNARQMGKSSLAVRTVAQLTASGVRTVYVDLQRLGGANVTPEQWYLGLLVEIGRGLGLRDEFLAYWREHREFSLIQRVLGAVREVALERYPESVVIFLDEIDTIRGLTFSTDELFGALRECYNHRVQDPVYGRLVFCLVGSALPSDLVRDPRTSPFNVGQRIELRDFTEQEVLPLAGGLDRPGAKALLRRVCQWTRGHPYLTQSLCAEIAGDPTVRRPRDVARAVARLFFDPKARERNVNLADVANRLLGSAAEGETPEEHRAAILDLYAQVRRGRKVVDDEADRRVAVLKLSGITRTVEGCLQVRNRIYARAFDQRWIAEQMPDAEVRRQKVAFRRGVLRTTAIALAMLALVGALAVTALRQARLARQSAEENRQRLARMNTAKGMQLVDEGDASGALPWLVEALRLDQGHPEREQPDRLRLAGALQRCPKPVHVWLHDGPIRWVEVSRDSRLVVTASDDKTARVWDVASGNAVGPPMRHSGPVAMAAFSPDGRRVATVSAGTARVWEVRSGKQVIPPLKHAGPVIRVAFSPDGARIATASESQNARKPTGARIAADETARIWDAGTGQPLTPELRLQGPVDSLAFSPDGGRLLTGNGVPGWGGAARVWDAQTGRPVTGLLGDWVTCAAFSPDGRQLVVGGIFTTRVWQAATGRPISAPLPHRAAVSYASFSPEGRRVVTASEDGTARVWEARNGQALSPPLRHGQGVTYAAFSPDGTSVLTASSDGTARVWDAETGQPVVAPLRHGGDVQARFVGDGRWVVTASDDGTARLWDLAVRPPGFSISVLGAVGAASFSPDGRHVATKVCCGGNQVWDARTGQPVTAILNGGSFFGGDFSPDGHYLAIRDGPGVRIWDIRTGKLLLQLVHPQAVKSAGFSPDGKQVVTSCEDNTARVWDAHTGHPVSPVWLRSGPVRLAGFSRDGRRVTTVSREGRVGLWEVATGHRVLLLPSLKDISWTALSSDGRRLLIVGDRYSHVWDVATGKRLVATTGWGSIGGFSPDGRRVLAQTGATARVWDAETGRPVTPPLKHNNELHSAVFSPDGRYVATSSADATARVWDAETGEPVTPSLDHLDPVSSAEFSPDGRQLVTASPYRWGRDWGNDQGSARIWDLLSEDRPLSHLQALARLLAGYQVDPSGNSAEISSEQFRTDWQALRSTSQTDFSTSPQQLFAWQLDRLRRCEYARQWSLAAALQDRLIAAHPTSRDLFLRAQNAHAQLGQWDRAAVDYARAIALSKVQDSRLWERLAMAQLEGGDLGGYRKTCAGMLARFGKDEDVFPRVAATCTRGPGALPDPERLVQLARDAAARHPKEPEWVVQVAAGLYRAEHYEEALKEFRRALAIDPGSVGDTEKLLLAMCQARLGHRDEARSWLKKAPRDFPGRLWEEHGGWQAQRREAEAVVGRGR
ncbi:MAG: AAA-like domain-containing protein [Armatimonadota bacterium]